MSRSEQKKNHLDINNNLKRSSKDAQENLLHIEVKKIVAGDTKMDEGQQVQNNIKYICIICGLNRD